MINAAYPEAATTRFDELVANDNYVAAIWGLRDELGEVAEPVFETYRSAQAADERYVALARERLEAAGLACTTAGRDFLAAARDPDLIVIDLFLGQGQDERDFELSKQVLGQVIKARGAKVPLVVLMSRSNRLQDKRDEFRDQAGLIDSTFRIIRKADLETDGALELQLERLAENLEDTRRLADFVEAINSGLAGAVDRTLDLLRKLKLSDLGQIQDLLLSAEGEAPGSYLVDVFDRVLQHEIERDEGIITAAKALNKFTAAKHPPPYLAGSPELQVLVSRLVAQNERRISLPGSLNSRVAFGDLLRLPAQAGEENPKLLRDLKPEHVLVVLTPACDLQRADAPRVFLLVGEVRDMSVAAWSYGPDLRTPAIRLDDELRWIKWNLKHVATAPGAMIAEQLDSGDLRLVGRLRESHALEIQQRVLAGLGRVGQVAALPATFPVDLEVYYPGADGKPSYLEVPELADGAVCWVGRDGDGDKVMRLVTTEVAVDGIAAALSNLDKAKVAANAHAAFEHVITTPDLRRQLASGMDLKKVTADGWKPIKSETGGQNLANMGLIAWNYVIPDEALKRQELLKTGFLLLIKDRQNGAPGFDDALRSGALTPEELIAPMVSPLASDVNDPVCATTEASPVPRPKRVKPAREAPSE